MAKNQYRFGIVIILTVFAWLPCACIGFPTSKPPELVTTVDEYQKLVPENLVKYLDMPVSVTGKLKKIDFYGGYRIVLGGKKETIDCIFAKTSENRKILSGLQNGQEINVIGETVILDIQSHSPRVELRKCYIKTN